MLRPLPPVVDCTLEPDGSDDPTTSVSMRRDRPVAPPVSIRAPVQVEDFAFADTVIAGDLADHDEPPPSLPIFFDDARSNPQCVTPLAFPLPDAAADVGFATKRRVFFAHVRHGLLRSREEMRELWQGTADLVEGSGVPRTATFGFFVRRVFALWSFFQWSGADVLRAAMIGGAVFVVAGTLGAVTLRPFEHDGEAAGSEVRAPRTLDQHTSREVTVHAKR
jgi:hypothetical protein